MINVTSLFVVEADLVARFVGVILVGDTLLKNVHIKVNTQTFSNLLLLGFCLLLLSLPELSVSQQSYKTWVDKELNIFYFLVGVFGGIVFLYGVLANFFRISKN